MALTKNVYIDAINIVKVADHWSLQCRERYSILEDNKEISANLHRFVLNPDHDSSTITDPVVKTQFEAVMTDEVKANYQAFLASQTEGNE